MEHSGTAMQLPARKWKGLKITRANIIETISALFILLFVYTAVSKLADNPIFQNVLRKSPLIGKYAFLISWAIPISELICAVLLFLPKFRKWGLYSALLLMLGFTGYLIYMIYFTPTLPCSCGGVLSQMTWKQHLIFNIFFTLLALTGIILNRKKAKANPRDANQPQTVFT